MRLLGSALSTFLFVLSSSGTLLVAQGLSDQARKEAQKGLTSTFLNKQLVAKVTFPGYKDGIDVKTDGTWDLKWVTRQIKDHGVGIEVGDKASVTDVKLKDKSIEIHLNGGGAGTFGDTLLTSSAKTASREGAGGKVPGGSRINLRFDHVITQDDLKDLDRLIAYFEPLVDTASLQQAAKRLAIPEEFKDAAAKQLVVVGMDKATVFAIMGEPKNKTVDLNADPPTEKWQFELRSLKTRIVTFQGGKVVKIDEI
jgi:hypothetical protein